MAKGGSEEEGKGEGNLEKKLQKYSELLERLGRVVSHRKIMIKFVPFEQDVKGVGEFFSNLGYPEVAKKFVENKIEGRLLPGLTNDHLVDAREIVEK
eukprot:CAMPEP_0185281058 /NCGR_PEP_ID=MMETSP1359-20130426/66502_1 /TAXON_ID=552665 /ORGANISM="Bigelowiella longifila, Strain CCMP242" /LENGTH=96 /DNA_ID=CAMNT_0027876439 /DNA_START=29 /DNA_END=320 /DNA_ORIENTATION=-